MSAANDKTCSSSDNASVVTDITNMFTALIAPVLNDSVKILVEQGVKIINKARHDDSLNRSAGTVVKDEPYCCSSHNIKTLTYAHDLHRIPLLSCLSVNNKCSIDGMFYAGCTTVVFNVADHIKFVPARCKQAFIESTLSTEYPHLRVEQCIIDASVPYCSGDGTYVYNISVNIINTGSKPIAYNEGMLEQHIFLHPILL